jgi:hypothetical protein
MSECTSSTFLILRKDLASISGRIVHHFQKLNEPAQYADVMKLQSELDGFVNALPPAFKMRHPDKSQDQGELIKSIELIIGHFWLPVHRFMLLTEVLVTTIILHVSLIKGWG